MDYAYGYRFIVVASRVVVNLEGSTEPSGTRAADGSPWLQGTTVFGQTAVPCLAWACGAMVSAEDS